MIKHNREDKLIEEIRRLERYVKLLEERLSDASWANEGRRNYDQEERSKWGIYG